MGPQLHVCEQVGLGAGIVHGLALPGHNPVLHLPYETVMSNPRPRGHCVTFHCEMCVKISPENPAQHPLAGPSLQGWVLALVQGKLVWWGWG